MKRGKVDAKTYTHAELIVREVRKLPEAQAVEFMETFLRTSNEAQRTLTRLAVAKAVRRTRGGKTLGYVVLCGRDPADDQTLHASRRMAQEQADDLNDRVGYGYYVARVVLDTNPKKGARKK